MECPQILLSGRSILQTVTTLNTFNHAACDTVYPLFYIELRAPLHCLIILFASIVKRSSPNRSYETGSGKAVARRYRHEYPDKPPA